MEASITDILASFFMLLGTALNLIAAVGIVRMPDLYTRMQAAAKTGTLGVGCIILAVAIYYADPGVATRAGLVILFLFLTNPIAAHMIARAGYFAGAPLWTHTVVDELKGRYDPDTHTLRADGMPDKPAPASDADLPGSRAEST